MEMLLEVPGDAFWMALVLIAFGAGYLVSKLIRKK
jgi:hypothetical protein